ncbi:flagellin FliC [Enterobacter roggenkampii]|uniref:flagellin N-terminal helical domain-containing protein n=1 Tax=Enterobacter roggenkampii TaxID=1812935 RepID=UPI001E442CF3|nr:flagellin [Enterobacter roggenkampii]MCD5295677.1 flagellin FliC [Enterobacter roggenkampii]MCD5305744.1 flagellin FliC [Enterobacter roggenkampii]MCD5317500.1 flagellin FliC [Enterobacter roggenkampii]MCD5365579.1 flagellin FliC [Enterobacter roggenkampii]MCD5376227.1 flagellin FliC [Enterobacter roggenkampii]
MAVINTNTLSLMTQNNLSKSQSSLGTAIERLSSGLRINSAKDDAAGQAIANRFTSNINGLTVAARNANDGISLAQTAEGALSEINNNLQRIRDLTVQAQNSSNSASDIDSIQAEVNQRMEEVNRVTTQTDFNGIKVLNTGSGTSSYSFQVGSKDSETISIGLSSSDSYNLFSVSTATGATGGMVNGNARTTSAEGFDVLSGTVTSCGTTDGNPLADIDAAIKSVDNQRSLLGASQNRFESTITNLNNTVNNLSAARSRIQDSDYATEVSNMSRAQILQQAGSSVLAQANQVPQTMLSLLR